MEHLVSHGELQEAKAKTIPKTRKQYFEEEYSKIGELTEDSWAPSSLFTPPHGLYVGGSDALIKEVDTKYLSLHCSN